MSNILEQLQVLSLNKAWQPIGVKTVGKALTDLMGGADPFGHPAFGLDIAYEEVIGNNDSIEYNFDQVAYLNPVKWEDWVNLPIRPYDQVVRSTRMVIRVPTVIVAGKYDKMPLKRMAVTGKNLYDLYGGKCAYSGKKLTRDQASLDHVLPKSRGGAEHWNNYVLADKELNNRKGNKTNEEAGLTLLVNPIEPTPKKVSETIKEVRHRDWKMFIKDK